VVTVSGNVIDSSEASGAGSRFNQGLVIGADVRFGGDVSMNHDETIVQNNQLHGCGFRALALDVTADGTSSTNVQS